MEGEACTGGGIQEVVWSLTGGGKGSPCLVCIGGDGRMRIVRGFIEDGRILTQIFPEQ